MQNVEQLAQFIHNHRDEDHAKIREQLSALPSADLAEVLNALASLGEAAEMLALVPLAKAIEVCDQPTLSWRPSCWRASPPTSAPTSCTA